MSNPVSIESRGKARAYISSLTELPGGMFIHKTLNQAVSGKIIYKGKVGAVLKSLQPTFNIFQSLGERSFVSSLDISFPVCSEDDEPTWISSLGLLNVKTKSLTYDSLDHLSIVCGLHCLSRYYERGSNDDLCIKSLWHWCLFFSFLYSHTPIGSQIIIPDKHGIFLGHLEQQRIPKPFEKTILHSSGRDHVTNEKIKTLEKPIYLKSIELKTFIGLDELYSEQKNYMNLCNKLYGQFDFLLHETLSCVLLKRSIPEAFQYHLAFREAWNAEAGATYDTISERGVQYSPNFVEHDQQLHDEFFKNKKREINSYRRKKGRSAIGFD